MAKTVELQSAKGEAHHVSVPKLRDPEPGVDNVPRVGNVTPAEDRKARGENAPKRKDRKAKFGTTIDLGGTLVIYFDDAGKATCTEAQWPSIAEQAKHQGIVRTN